MRVENKLTLQLKVHVPSGFLIGNSELIISSLFPIKFFLVFIFVYISFNLFVYI